MAGDADGPVCDHSEREHHVWLTATRSRAALRGRLPRQSATDISIRAGADGLGRARLFMPNPVVGGSSGSHYDSPSRSRNLLMEPAINRDLTHSVKAPEDLTLELLRDVGWFADADVDGKADELDCDATSDTSATVVIGEHNTGVPNTMFANGCTINAFETGRFRRCRQNAAERPEQIRRDPAAGRRLRTADARCGTRNMCGDGTAGVR